MSFTISHVAAVLPLIGIADWKAKKNRGSQAKRNVSSEGDEAVGGHELALRMALISGLTIGSMFPDAEKLTPVFRHRVIEARLLHNPVWFVILGLPLCLVAAWFFSYAIPVMQRAIGFVGRLDTRLVAPRSGALTVRFLLASLVGGISHIMLDSFTHGFGFVTHHVDTLRRVIQVGGRYLTVSKLLFYITSAVGLVVVGLVVLRLLLRATWTKPNWKRLATLVGVTGIAFGFGLIRYKRGQSGLYNASKFGFLFASGVFFMAVGVFIVLDKLGRLASTEIGSPNV